MYCHHRKDGQGSLQELERRDLKLELEEKERKHFSKTCALFKPPNHRFRGRACPLECLPKATAFAQCLTPLPPSAGTGRDTWRWTRLPACSRKTRSSSQRLAAHYVLR